jgi:mono/diheme cytochrome c family protein/glucose/arabinose dehydrogenase
MFSFHSKLALGVVLGLLLPSSLSIAQQGDRKGHVMKDPIPQSKIPPSPYLDLKAATKAFKVADGYVIEPVASGKDVNMVLAVSFDGNGRAWTAEMRSYMPNIDGTGEDTPNGKIRVLEDTDGDGEIDKTTIFLDGLILPRAVAVTSDGCLYTSGDVLYFTKREGLKPVGKPIIVDKEYALGGNAEHKANGLLYGHDNWYYSAKSSSRYRRINSTWTKQATDFRGQWAVAKDDWGRLYYNSNSTLLKGDQFSPNFFRGNPGYTPKTNTSHRIGSNKTNPIRITPGVNRAYMKGTLDKDGKLANATAACGVHIYRGDNFPKSELGTAFVCEPAGDLVKAIKIERDQWHKPSGSHPYGDEEFLATTDEWFLPCNLYTAPDGTLWMVDMYFGLLQHKTYMTSYLRKQYLSRGLDKPKPSTGRIYRIRYSSNKPSLVPRLEGLAPARLIEFLSHANGTIRDTAQRLIVESADISIEKALVEVAADNSKPLGQIHALWALEGLGKFPAAAFQPAIKSQNDAVVNTALDVMALARSNDESMSKILKATPMKPSNMHTLVRAMAANGLADQALDIVSKNTKVNYINEAFISGLGSDAKAFQKKHGKLADKALGKLLVSAAKTAKVKTTVDGAHLKGQALASFKRGKESYITKAACFGCHGGNGAGLPNLGPPLTPSEWVTGDPERLAKLMLVGMTGPVTVNGTKYTPAAVMPGIKHNPSLKDQDIADVMTYIRNAWANKSEPVSAVLIKKTRTATKDRNTPYQEKDLRK